MADSLKCSDGKEGRVDFFGRELNFPFSRRY